MRKARINTARTYCNPIPLPDYPRGMKTYDPRTPEGDSLDPDTPNRLITERALLFAYTPDHEWERFGDFNEDLTTNYPSMRWRQRPCASRCGAGPQAFVRGLPRSPRLG
jgi:hypothetical protein